MHEANMAQSEAVFPYMIMTIEINMQKSQYLMRERETRVCFVSDLPLPTLTEAFLWRTYNVLCTNEVLVFFCAIDP